MMKINALRKELITLLNTVPSGRPPVIRRCLDEDWLYTTDLPVLCTEEEKKRAKEKLSGAGWETEECEGWMMMRKSAEEPPEDWYGGCYGPEANCCLSLLDRHADRDENAGPVQRMLIKAGEEGEKAYEEACAALHRNWAGRLRKKEPLPAVSRRYFGNTEEGL